MGFRALFDGWQVRLLGVEKVFLVVSKNIFGCDQKKGLVTTKTRVFGCDEKIFLVVTKKTFQQVKNPCFFLTSVVQMNL